MKPPLRDMPSNANAAWIRWFNSPFTYTPLDQVEAVFTFSYNTSWTLVSGMEEYIPDAAKVVTGSIQLVQIGSPVTPMWLDLAPDITGKGRMSFQLYSASALFALTQPLFFPLINNPSAGMYYRFANQNPDVTTGLAAPGGNIYMYISGYWI